MAVIKPFRALRPMPSFVSDLVSRPYDVLNREEAIKETKGNPYSYYHITKPEIDLPELTDPYSREVYEKADENLEAFQKKAYLFREESPCFYLYQLKMREHVQTGIVAVSSVEDYEKGVIKKHELTRTQKEQDRINHILTTRAQTGNVFLAYRDLEELQYITQKGKEIYAPIYDFLTDDEVRHTVWRIDDEEFIHKIEQLFKDRVTSTYIADGHHRAASAAKVYEQLKATDEAEEDSGYFLTTLFPDSELEIIDYNRVVKDLKGIPSSDFLDQLKADFEVTLIGEKRVKPETEHVFGMYLDGQWYQLEARSNIIPDDPVGGLDISILQKEVLEKLLGIGNPRTDERIDFVGGIRGLEELEKRVDSGEMEVAFAIYPVTMEQLFNVTDAGLLMPPKSTWFEPKLRDGLFTHLI